MSSKQRFDNSNINIYEHLPPEYKHKQNNPDFANHQLTLPFRALIVSRSGGGKTQMVAELLRRTPNTWSSVDICCRDKDEPIYKYMYDNDADGLVQFFENDDVPDLKEFANDGKNKLIVFDDRCLSKNQDAMSEYFVRGRKKQVSCIYISQSFYKCPKIIRDQLTYVFLKGISGKRDLNSILAQYDLGVNKNQLQQIFTAATHVPNDFLTIDLVGAHRFKHNFLEPFQIS